MDIQTLTQILNNGIPAEALGGITSSIIIDLFNRVKNLFGNKKEVTTDEVKQIIDENIENKNLVQELLNELSKSGLIVNNAEKIEIKYQFINSNFDNPTFQ
jgi:hypothetical protein